MVSAIEVGLGSRPRRSRARVHELHRAGLVAQHDELHLLLIAHGVDPAGDGHGAVGEGGEVLDQGAFSHGDRVYRRAQLDDVGFGWCPPTVIHLVRHGEVSQPRRRPLRAPPRVPPLRARAPDGGGRGAESLDGHPITALYASPLLRAQESAAPWAKTFGLPIADRRAHHRADEQVRGHAVEFGAQRAAPAREYWPWIAQPAQAQLGRAVRRDRGPHAARRSTTPGRPPTAARSCWSATSCRSGWCTAASPASRSPTTRASAAAPSRASRRSTRRGRRVRRGRLSGSGARLARSIRRPGSRVRRRSSAAALAVAAADSCSRGARATRSPSTYRAARTENYISGDGTVTEIAAADRGRAGRLRRARPTPADRLERRLRGRGPRRQLLVRGLPAVPRRGARPERACTRSSRATGVEFLGVNVRDGADGRRLRAARYGITYPSIIDAGRRRRAARLRRHGRAERGADDARARQEGRVAARILGARRPPPCCRR